MFELFGRFKVGLRALANNQLAAANNVFFGGWRENGWGEVVVTDGVILGVIPVRQRDGEGDDEPGAIPVAAWNRAMSGTSSTESRRVQIQKNWIKVFDDAGKPVVAVPRSAADVQMPDYKRVVPKPREQRIALQIDPTSLVKLANVLGSPTSLTLHMDASEKHGVVDRPVRVSQAPWSGDDQPHGVVLPTQINVDRNGNEIPRQKKVAETVSA